MLRKFPVAHPWRMGPMIRHTRNVIDIASEIERRGGCGGCGGSGDGSRRIHTDGPGAAEPDVEPATLRNMHRCGRTFAHPATSAAGGRPSVRSVGAMCGDHVAPQEVDHGSRHRGVIAAVTSPLWIRGRA